MDPSRSSQGAHSQGNSARHPRRSSTGMHEGLRETVSGASQLSLTEGISPSRLSTCSNTSETQLGDVHAFSIAIDT